MVSTFLEFLLCDSGGGWWRCNKEGYNGGDGNGDNCGSDGCSVGVVAGSIKDERNEGSESTWEWRNMFYLFLGNFPLSSKNVFQLIKIFLSHKIPKNKGNICFPLKQLKH